MNLEDITTVTPYRAKPTTLSLTLTLTLTPTNSQATVRWLNAIKFELEKSSKMTEHLERELNSVKSKMTPLDEKSRALDGISDTMSHEMALAAAAIGGGDTPGVQLSDLPDLGLLQEKQEGEVRERKKARVKMRINRYTRVIGT